MTTAPVYGNSVRTGYARVCPRAREHQAQPGALAAAHCREIVIETASTRSGPVSSPGCTRRSVAARKGSSARRRCGQAVELVHGMLSPRGGPRSAPGTSRRNLAPAGTPHARARLPGAQAAPAGKTPDPAVTRGRPAIWRVGAPFLRMPRLSLAHPPAS